MLNYNIEKITTGPESQISILYVFHHHTHEFETPQENAKKGKQFHCSNKSFKSISFNHNHLDNYTTRNGMIKFTIYM